MEKIVAYTLLLVSLVGCNWGSISPNCKPIQLTDNIEKLTSADLYTIQQVTVKQNTLEIQVAYGGGCDPNHSFELYFAPDPLIDAIGFYFDAKLTFQTNDYCKRLDYKTLCFDLRAIKKKYGKRGTIALRGYKSIAI